MATLEPVVAAVIGVTVMGDVLTIWNVIGMILIVSAAEALCLNAPADGTAAVSRTAAATSACSFFMMQSLHKCGWFGTMMSLCILFPQFIV